MHGTLITFICADATYFIYLVHALHCFSMSCLVCPPSLYNNSSLPLSLSLSLRFSIASQSSHTTVNRHSEAQCLSLSLQLPSSSSSQNDRRRRGSETTTMMVDSMDAARIIDYFKGKCILVTGSTGFLGKSMCSFYTYISTPILLRLHLQRYIRTVDIYIH
jgi:hypothetical protein